MLFCQAFANQIADFLLFIQRQQRNHELVDVSRVQLGLGAASSMFLGLELADNRLKHHGHVGVVDIGQQPQDVDLIAGKSQSPVEINIGSAYVCTGGVNQQVPGLEVRFGWCVEGVLSGFFALELRVCLDYV